MILKRQEKDNIIKSIYNSSDILASVFDRGSNDLTLIFSKGRQYKYSNIKPADYLRFELAESQGKVFNSHIKTYGAQKLDDINPDLIIKEIETLKTVEAKADLDAKKGVIIKNMEDLLSFIKIDDFDYLIMESKFNTIKTNMDIYLNKLKE